jgi:hypothetical protein
MGQEYALAAAAAAGSIRRSGAEGPNALLSAWKRSFTVSARLEVGSHTMERL